MEPGTLYIIATPIGNLEDITLRALNTLRERIELIFCEDTRHTKKLISYYNIKLPTISLHAHSADSKIDFAIKQLEQGKCVAYMTDSGTPGISDPGAKLVRAALLKKIQIIPVPGPSALTALLSVSGFPSKNILFLGFLSKKDSRKRRELEEFRDFKGILVIFESPYRVKKLLNIIYEIFPESQVIVGREITKIYEEFISGNIEAVHNNLEDIKELGEFAIAILTDTK
ncbi:MAG: 16S rRNA (cytidine(1402)-2'-O)-methyltransferase [Spirochaetota bacterium]